MKIALRHHHGVVEYDVEAETVEDAAYKAVRESHPFLTDDNHGADPGGGSVVITYNEKSSARARNGLTPSWHMTAPGDFWFAVSYFVPIEEEETR